MEHAVKQTIYSTAFCAIFGKKLCDKVIRYYLMFMPFFSFYYIVFFFFISYLSMVVSWCIVKPVLFTSRRRITKWIFPFLFPFFLDFVNELLQFVGPWLFSVFHLLEPLCQRSIGCNACFASMKDDRKAKQHIHQSRKLDEIIHAQYVIIIEWEWIEEKIIFWLMNESDIGSLSTIHVPKSHVLYFIAQMVKRWNIN